MIKKNQTFRFSKKKHSTNSNKKKFSHPLTYRHTKSFSKKYGKIHDSFYKKREKYLPESAYEFQKQLKYQDEQFDPSKPVRLNKYLANAGTCSRREADEYIQKGLIKINGQVITKLGLRVNSSDKVTFHDEPIRSTKKVYVLLNKPKNCVTTTHDQQERFTVLDLVKKACFEPIFPVGRLDRNTTGVLLLTNDGDLSNKLIHPSYKKKKIYHAWLNKEFLEIDMKKLSDGIILDDEEIYVDDISYIDGEDKTQIGIEIHSGKNRIIRRLFDALGYRVLQLDRVYFAGLTKKRLKKGQWRFLSEREVTMLYKGIFN